MTEIRIYENANPVNLFIENLLVGKILPDKLRAVVMMPTRPRVADLDRQLWVRKPEHFIPHCLSSHMLASKTPILLASADSAEEAEITDVLISCCDEIAPNFAAYEHLIDIVPSKIEQSKSAQARLAEYKSRGHQIKRFDMKAPRRSAARKSGK